MSALHSLTRLTENHGGKIVIVMVGLPARGKTYISQKVARYLNWLGVQTAVFDVGKYRRELLGAKQSAEFFDHNNKEAVDNRMRVMQAALHNMVVYLRSGAQVAILDATNSTDKARRLVLDRLQQEGVQAQAIFLECLCDDPSVIKATIEEETSTSPDYLGASLAEALADFEARIEFYRKHYESVDDKSLSFVKLINVGQRLIVNQVKGYVPTRIVYFLMNTHIVRRNIFLCRDGQSKADELYLQGATADLSASGVQFSHRLKTFMDDKHADMSPFPGGKVEHRPLVVWTSTSERSKQTAAMFPEAVQWKSLADLNPGVVDGLTPEEIWAKYPDEFEKHKKDSYNHRYPRAESYRDLTLRVEPVLLELERMSSDVMVVAHETVLRCLLAYFSDIPMETIPTIDIPENTLIRLIPHAYKCDITMYKI